jgi:hypothetical protein
MVERGSAARFSQEPGARGFGVVNAFDELQRDVAAQRGVVGEKHRAHGPAAEQALDAVIA